MIRLFRVPSLLLPLLVLALCLVQTLVPPTVLVAGEQPEGSEPPVAASISRLASIDTAMIAVADMTRVAQTAIFQGLLAQPEAAPLQNLLNALIADTSFNYRQDLSAVYFFAANDQLSTLSVVGTGRFPRERLDTFLRIRYGAVQLGGTGEYAYRLTLRNRPFYLAFPTPKLAILTFGEARLTRQLQVISGQSQALGAHANTGWYPPAAGNPPVSIFFRDLGMFVGGQQPFALVGRTRLFAQESGTSVAAAFEAELPDAASADQFTQLLNALRQLAAGYLRNASSPATAGILERITIHSQNRTSLARSEEPVAELVKILSENQP